MEEVFVEIANLVALCIEAGVVAVLAVASIIAAARMLRMAIARESALFIRRNIFLAYGSAIALALEFSLASDIIRSAISPSWDAIGKLAAIAAVRIALNFFLMRDIESLSEESEENPERETPAKQ